MKKLFGYTIILQIRTINVNHMMYGSSDMKHDGQNVLSFLPFYNPKNQNFQKLEKMPGDIIILYLCTINTSII